MGYNIIENHIWGTNAYYGHYGSTPGYSLTGNIASNDSAHDAALACLGAGKRMPTVEECDELYNNCTITKVTSYNGLTINGHVFKSKKTGYTDKEIFIPMAGFGYNTSIYNVGEYTYYWSSTVVNNGQANGMYAYPGNSMSSRKRIDKYYGCSVRAVMDK